MQVAVPAEPEKAGSLALPIVLVLWLSLAWAGRAALWLYSITAGKEGGPPDRWSPSSRLQRTPGATTLPLFFHPRGPCSQGRINEPAVVLAPSRGGPPFCGSPSTQLSL